MARIIYGVAGEGFGHSSRSHVIGRRLLDAGHEVLFAASRKSLHYLRQYFGDRVKELAGLCLVYDHGKLRPCKTVARNIHTFFAGGHAMNLDLYRRDLDRFGADVVITDFEPFTAWWAWRNGVPFISVDHEHLLTHCAIEHPDGSFVPRTNARVVTQLYYFGAAAYIVVNFFKAPARKNGTAVAPPVVRPVVHAMQAADGDHVLVYSTDRTAKPALLDVFSRFAGRKFLVYGFDEDSRHANCTFKKTSTEGFLRDLSCCRGVVATAGFSLISECLLFKKRMLLLPVLGQYEQMVNAHYVQKLGLGRWTKQLDANALSAFLDSLDDPLSSDDDVLWPDNAGLFRILDDALTKINSRLSISPALSRPAATCEAMLP